MKTTIAAALLVLTMTGCTTIHEVAQAQYIALEATSETVKVGYADPYGQGVIANPYIALSIANDYCIKSGSNFSIANGKQYQTCGVEETFMGCSMPVIVQDFTCITK